jgi:hypothetical protein
MTHINMKDASNCGGAGTAGVPPHPYQAYSRDAFMLEERGTARSVAG